MLCSFEIQLLTVLTYDTPMIGTEQNAHQDKIRKGPPGGKATRMVRRQDDDVLVVIMI